MNQSSSDPSGYFHILNMPFKFDINLVDLQQNYLTLQARGERLTEINNAYGILSSSLKRAEYLLTSANVAVSNLDMDFLERTLELQEQIEGEGNLSEMLSDVQQKIDEAFHSLSREFSAGSLSAASSIVAKLKFWYRLKRQIEAKRDEGEQ